MKFLDVTFYRNFHLDLKSMELSDKELIQQYNEYGSVEGRIASESEFYEFYSDYDLDFYNYNYEDLSIFNGDKYMLMWHYHNYGFKEGRICTKFDPIFYNNFHLDIKSLQLNEKQLKESYENYGKKEGRLCCESDFYALYPNFDLDFYNDLCKDLSFLNGDKYMLMWHYHNYGFKEGRKICTSEIINLTFNNKIIIYILCHNKEKYNNAFIIYKKYSWAKPILMKYQDYSFENSFWIQLSEIENEWEDCNMIGTLSYSAFKKINLDVVDSIITNNLYEPNVYYHFMDSNISIPNSNTIKHPYFDIIWKDSLINLKLLDTTESNGNYWMCKPSIMKYFLKWYINLCSKILIKHPYIFEDALYTGEDYNNSVRKDNLIKIWGKSYYPHYTFIVERLNKSFFISNHKIAFLISHEKSFSGAVNVLRNVQKFYEKNSIKTVLLYLPDLLEKQINIIDYIKNTSNNYNCSPVVICNTLICYNIVKKLSFTNIPTFWYIHEWYDKNNNYFPFINNELHLFNSNIYIILICKKMYENYKQIAPNLNNVIIINNGYSNEVLEEKKNKNLEISIDINTNKDFIISIIGTIEKRKNQQSFVDDVFYKLIEKYPNIKLLLVGKISENLEIKKKYEKNIILTGCVTNALPYIKISEIVISYSVNEVFPLNIIEAFYCSKPVVSSNVGGVSEMIENNVNGYLFEVNDSEKCYDYLNILIENKELRNYIGNNAREKFDKNYQENIAFQKFLLLLSYTNKISYTSIINDLNLNFKYNNEGKSLTLLACHTDNSIKINTLLNNIKYFIEISDDIVIINSKEFDKLNFEEKIYNMYSNSNIIFNDYLPDKMCTSYKEMYFNELKNYNNEQLRRHWLDFGKKENRNISKKEKTINIIFKYYDNDVHLCHGKWLNYLKTINFEEKSYDNFILANDSYIVTKSLKKFSDLKVFNTELYGIVTSNEFKYHYPDFLRGYNKTGIKKIINYYEKTKFLIHTYDDAVKINEINSTYIFDTKNVLYEIDNNYEENIHFHDDKIKDYLLNRDYPIIKLKKIMQNAFDKKEFEFDNIKITDNFIPSEYKLLNSDLKKYNDFELEKHYLNYGRKEKRLCNLESFINLLPDFLREYLDKKNLIKIFKPLENYY